MEPGPFTFHHQLSGEANGMERGYLLIARVKLKMGLDDLVRFRVLRASWCEILSSPSNLKWII